MEETEVTTCAPYPTVGEMTGYACGLIVVVTVCFIAAHWIVKIMKDY